MPVTPLKLTVLVPWDVPKYVPLSEIRVPMVAEFVLRDASTGVKPVEPWAVVNVELHVRPRPSRSRSPPVKLITYVVEGSRVCAGVRVRVSPSEDTEIVAGTGIWVVFGYS